MDEQGESLMVEKKRNLAAPWGYYCGACPIYLANRRGDPEFLTLIKGHLVKLFSDLEEGQKLPAGMPPPIKQFDLAQLQNELKGDMGGMCCEGCLSDKVGFLCGICGFRACAQERGLTNCSQCADVPCQWLIDFSNDGILSHASFLESLERQKEIGIDGWLAEQEERWRCDQCGTQISYYEVECPNCHANQSQTFGFLPPIN